jgi:hypothetical protein
MKTKKVPFVLALLVAIFGAACQQDSNIPEAIPWVSTTLAPTRGAEKILDAPDMAGSNKIPRPDPAKNTAAKEKGAQLAPIHYLDIPEIGPLIQGEVCIDPTYFRPNHVPEGTDVSERIAEDLGLPRLPEGAQIGVECREGELFRVFDGLRVGYVRAEKIHTTETVENCEVTDDSYYTRPEEARYTVPEDLYEINMQTSCTGQRRYADISIALEGRMGETVSPYFFVVKPNVVSEGLYVSWIGEGERELHIFYNYHGTVFYFGMIIVADPCTTADG